MRGRWRPGTVGGLRGEPCNRWRDRLASQQEGKREGDASLGKATKARMDCARQAGPGGSKAHMDGI